MSVMVIYYIHYQSHYVSHRADINGNVWNSMKPFDSIEDKYKGNNATEINIYMNTSTILSSEMKTEAVYIHINRSTSPILKSEDNTGDGYINMNRSTYSTVSSAKKKGEVYINNRSAFPTLRTEMNKGEVYINTNRSASPTLRTEMNKGEVYINTSWSASPTLRTEMNKGEVYIDMNNSLTLASYGKSHLVNMTTPEGLLFTTKHHKEVWHIFTNGTTEIYIYSAIYDNRDHLNGTHYVRLFAISRNLPDQLFCLFWNTDKEGLGIRKAHIDKNGHGHYIDKLFHDQHFYSCEVEKDSHGQQIVPTYVTMTLQPSYQKPSHFIPVQIPRIPGSFNSQGAVLGICVSVSFHHTDLWRIAEWVETNRLFGVHEINIYPANISESNLKLLQHYEKEGIVKLFPIPCIKECITFDGNAIYSAIALNDCMYRNMYKYKYVICIDFDEYIISQKNYNYDALLKNINTSYNVTRFTSGYSFLNTYFWVSCNQSKDDPANSYIFRYFRHVSPSPGGVKSFINPRLCLSLFNHYCLIPLPGISGAILVAPSIAKLHHYRILHDGKSCTDVMKDTEVDTIMQRYEDIVYPKAKIVVEMVKVNSINSSSKTTTGTIS